MNKKFDATDDVNVSKPNSHSNSAFMPAGTLNLLLPISTGFFRRYNLDSNVIIPLAGAGKSSKENTSIVAKPVLEGILFVAFVFKSGNYITTKNYNFRLKVLLDF